MKNPTSLSLFGFVNPTKAFPSFLVPVFGDGDGQWIQDGFHEFTVTRFAPCEIDSEEIISLGPISASHDSDTSPKHTKNSVFVRVGDKPLYAFAFEDKEVLYGTAEVLKARLEDRLSEIRRHTFVFIEVCGFLGKQRELLSAFDEAKAILRQVDSQTAERWYAEHIAFSDSMLTQTSVIDVVKRTLTEFRNVRIHFDPPPEPATEGAYVSWTSIELDAAIQQFFESQFPRGLFRHQARAIDHVLKRVHTVVATRTSSGKSLIYALPVLQSLVQDPKSTAMFLFPQKALASDQLIKLRQQLAGVVPLANLLSVRQSFVSRYDGATPDNVRPQIREQAHIVLTNPDMLHLGILPWHEKHWSRFLANLKHVVIDEGHEYRGIFGTNVAYILHRLRQLCARYGSSPTFIATSATMADPQEHLGKLTGLPFTCVDSSYDGSRQGRKKFWMLSGQEHFYDLGRKVAMQLAEVGLSVLAFCPSRVAAERMLARILSAKEKEATAFVRVYRAGLSAQEREEIENGLRDKSVRVVFSTSALELGIDIGAIDVVLCIGLPNSMMSLWQRAGRTARAGKDGAVVFIPADTPIDSYYSAHPGELFAKSNEPLVLNLTNRRVVHQHYACAVREVGDEDKLDLAILGDTMRKVKTLRAEGKLDEDIFYRSDPHRDINIRSMGEGSYKLICAGNEIGEIDQFHLLREAYRNAIYRHGGAAFRVKDVIKGSRKVILDRERSWNETTAFLQKKIRLKRRKSIADYSGVMIATVAIDVNEFLLNVVEKDRTGAVVNQWQGAAGMPGHFLPTEGTLILLRKPLWERIVTELGYQPARSALQSCERLFGSLFPTVSGPCDTQDFSSTSEIWSDGQAAIYLYDMVYDGVDLTTGAFDRISELVERSLDRLTSCDCTTDEGCFRCIANPRVPEPASKKATEALLIAIRAVVGSEEPVITRTTVTPLEELGPDAPLKCRACGTAMAATAKFCSNCGEKLGE